MAELGTSAMAAGARDLSAGPEFLKAQAEKAHLRVLSANLRGADQKQIFPASTVVNVGGVRVGLVGVTAASVSGAQPPVPAALAEARALRPKVDVVVVLAAIAYPDALQLSTQADEAIDFILQSNEARGAGFAQHEGRAFVMPSGERGRAVGRLALTLQGKGAFLDETEIDRDRQTIKGLDAQIADVKKRADAAKDAATKKQWLDNVDSFEKRKREITAQIDAAPKNGRSFGLDWATLGNDVKGDPQLQARVLKIEPSPAPH